MDKKLKFELIKEAQEKLVKIPENELHEITHSYRVWLNCLQIIKEENIINANSDLLELSSWWHDIPTDLKSKDERNKDWIARFLRKKLQADSNQEATIIFDIISNHEFGSIPKTLEGKIFQDADKLELVSSERIRIGYESFLAGKLDEKYLVESAKGILQIWFPKLDGNFHFQYSNIIFSEKRAKTEKEIHELIKSIKLS